MVRREGKRWTDRKTGEFLRAVTLPEDSELITRHEVSGCVARLAGDELLDA